MKTMGFYKNELSLNHRFFPTVTATKIPIFKHHRFCHQRYGSYSMAYIVMSLNNDFAMLILHSSLAAKNAENELTHALSKSPFYDERCIITVHSLVQKSHFFVNILNFFISWIIILICTNIKEKLDVKTNFIKQLHQIQ